MHAKTGVERGLKSTGTPVEVMGIMIGRPDMEDHEAMLVTDVRAGGPGDAARRLPPVQPA